ncbi:hypothetical protein [Sedimenticola sp.]|uniref:hypothetical protein n=1 Tax=Sedimenticola sp. TaxID=1940285 RepID=UPI003D11416F
MIIADSKVSLASDHSLVTRNEERERLKMWRDGQSDQTIERSDKGSGIGRLVSAFAREAPRLTLSSEAVSLQPVKMELKEPEPLEPAAELEVSLLKLLVERLVGRAFKLVDTASIKADTEAEMPDAPATEDPSASSERVGWGMTYDYYASRYESEQTHFSATAEVKTAEGQSLTVSISLNMSREFYAEQRISLRAGDALKDPLVINFDGTAAQLTRRDFSFDIDADGRLDQIAFVGEGSGLLALDKNQDGQINHGGELFGALTGDGFKELAALDEDGNGWIDEADTIYDRLRIWSKDAQGNDRLVGLGQQGVGAIYLGNVATSFLINDAETNALGQVRSSGIYLTDSGSAGTVQQLDLVV